MGDYSSSHNSSSGLDKQLHILAFPFPIPGHINPLMYFCKRLVGSPSAGISVTFACNEDSYRLAIRTRDLGGGGSSPEKLEVVQLLDGLPPKEGAGRGKPNPSENLERPAQSALGMRHPLEELIQRLHDQGRPVVCILTDTFNGWVQDVADKFNIPKAAFWTSNAINDILHLHLPQLMEKGLVPVQDCKQAEAVIDFLPGLKPMPGRDLPLSFHYEHPVLYTVSDGARRYAEAEFGLCNTFEELEQQAVSVLRRELKSKYYCIGPCLSEDFFAPPKSSLARSSAVLSAEDLRCLDWLDMQAPSSVIYVSFGSVATMSKEQAEQLAMGLEQSGHRFLLVIRKTLVSDDDGFYDGLVKRTHGRSLVVTWAPQMHVLLHTSVGGFLTHCGWNSTVEAICAGVPMIAWPCMAEQNVNCRELVNNWRIALEVPGYAGPQLVSASTVAALVTQLMAADAGAEMRERAAGLRRAAAAAVAPGGSSHAAMLAFADAVRQRSRCT